MKAKALVLPAIIVGGLWLWSKSAKAAPLTFEELVVAIQVATTTEELTSLNRKVSESFTQGEIDDNQARVLFEIISYRWKQIG